LSERIRELRKFLNLNQTEFGNKIGVKQGSVASYENGARVPLDSVILSICREFNVNERWLRTGEGDMLKPTSNVLASYMSEIDSGNDEFIKSFIEVYMELDEASRQVIKSAAKKMAEKYIKKEQN
jgi:transcriptional regulator with XRE-family HTH domain